MRKAAIVLMMAAVLSLSACGSSGDAGTSEATKADVATENAEAAGKDETQSVDDQVI